MRLLLMVIFAMALVGPAHADRKVTAEERASIDKALAAVGCKCGKFEFDDDGKFEVEGAICDDGKEYEIDLDKSFNIIQKKLDT